MLWNIFQETVEFVLIFFASISLGLVIQIQTEENAVVSIVLLLFNLRILHADIVIFINGVTLWMKIKWWIGEFRCYFCKVST